MGLNGPESIHQQSSASKHLDMNICMVYFTRTDVLKKKEKATELLNPEFIFELVSLQDRNPTKGFQRMEVICVTIGGYARSNSFYL